jgi:hypothetical protein
MCKQSRVTTFPSRNLKELTMKRLTFLALFALAAGCAGSDTAGETANSQPLAGEPSTGNPDEPTASPVQPPEGNDCELEIGLVCPENAVDGCTIRNSAGETLTTRHICVKLGETTEGTPCEQEIARECGAGFVDACGMEPAVASIHTCILKPSSPDDSVGPDSEATGEPAAEGAGQ